MLISPSGFDGLSLPIPASGNKSVVHGSLTLTRQNQLYELLMSWKSTGRYVVTVEEFNKVMETPASFRINFKDLRINVIEPSIKSINSRTDLMVQYSTIKKGRKVAGLEFRFIQNPEQQLDFEDGAGNPQAKIEPAAAGL